MFYMEIDKVNTLLRYLQCQQDMFGYIFHYRGLEPDFFSYNSCRYLRFPRILSNWNRKNCNLWENFSINLGYTSLHKFTYPKSSKGSLRCKTSKVNCRQLFPSLRIRHNFDHKLGKLSKDFHLK